MPMKHKASKMLTPLAPVIPPTRVEMFIAPTADLVNGKVYSQIMVVHGCSDKRSLDIFAFFYLLVCFSLEYFLFISEDVYERLYCSNLYCPSVFEGEETVRWSYFLDVSIAFSLSSLCDMLNLFNKVDCIFLNANYKFDLLSKTESKVYSKDLASFTFGRIVTATHLKPKISSFQNLLLANIIPRAGHHDFFQPLQAVFMYALSPTRNETLNSLVLKLRVPSSQNCPIPIPNSQTSSPV